MSPRDWVPTNLDGLGQIHVSSSGAKMCRLESPEGTAEILKALVHLDLDWRLTNRPDPAALDAVVQIDISAMDRVLRLEPQGGYMHVQAAATLGAIQAAAKSEGFTIGPVPAHLREKPLYEVLGYEFQVRPSPKYGAIRDNVLAIQAALADGLTECALAPRRAMGPDLMRCLMAGVGNPGILTDCHMHIWPLPKHEGPLTIACPTQADAVRVMRSIRQDGIRPSLWHARSEKDRWVLDIYLEETYELSNIRSRVVSHAHPFAVSDMDDPWPDDGYERVGWVAENEGEGASVVDVRPGEFLVQMSLETSTDPHEPWDTYFDIYSSALKTRGGTANEH